MAEHIISDNAVLKARAVAQEEMSNWRIVTLRPEGLRRTTHYIVDDEPRFHSKKLKDASGKPLTISPPDTQVTQAKCVSQEQAHAFISHQTWRAAIMAALTEMEKENTRDGAN